MPPPPMLSSAHRLSASAAPMLLGMRRDGSLAVMASRGAAKPWVWVAACLPYRERLSGPWGWAMSWGQVRFARPHCA